MCGVIGIVSKEPVVRSLLFGMSLLQHRGQDAAGVAVFSEEDYYYKKSQGLVDQVFQHEYLDEVTGCVGVGHTRYPTAGSNKDDDAHPFLVKGSSKIALVQNGNLTNFFEMRNTLRRKGVFLETESDAEIMSKIIAHELEVSQDIFYAVQRLMSKVKGAYSIVVAVEDKGILAFRDPHGIKPLQIGKKQDSYCVTSESIVFDALGYDLVRDVQPGEVVFIDRHLNVVSRSVEQGQKAHCMFEWIYFARPDSKLDGRSVYNARLKLGRLLAERWDKEIDVVIPVPDTARTAAIGFSEALGVQYREGLIKNRYMGRTFIMPTQSLREKAVKLKLSPIRSTIEGKRVALVDDSIVRGTTSKSIVKMVRDAGAKEVHFISTCPPIISPCHYGIDMSTKEELIAGHQDVEGIRTSIGADSLTYITVPEIQAAIKKEALCTGCLTEEYPSLITDEQMTEMMRSRSIGR